MKRTFTIAAIAAATILAASCAKEIEGGLQNEGIIVYASLQPVEATKAIGEYSYNIVWEENDQIAVLDNANNKASFKLKEGTGSTTGTFQQEGTDALTAPLTAYYPASVVADDKSLVWPATQADVKNITNVPMMAESTTATGDVNFAFKHLGSVLQLVLTAKNGTIAVKQIDITADQGLSGAFTVEDGTAVISSTGTTITTGDISDKNIKLSAVASYLNFAVPSGSFTNFKITITDNNGKEYSLSAASLTLEHAMVNKVTFAMDAKDPAVFELEVNGHTVKVQLADDIAVHDVIVDAYVDGDDVIIRTSSYSGRHLKCTMPDGELCTSQSRTSNLVYAFTISDITDNTTATIGYAKALSIVISPADAGKVNVIGGDLYEGELVRLVPEASYKYGISSWKDQNGKLLNDGYDFTVRLPIDMQVNACFEKNLILGGVFTIDKSGNQVRFTRGNLYRDSWYGSIEQHQYDSNSAAYTDNIAHVSHFMWCNNIENASVEYYYMEWLRQTPFFANDEGFIVNGISKEGTCFALLDWTYLLAERKAGTVNGTENARYFKGCIKQYDGSTSNGLFIFPDEFTWPKSVMIQPSGINEGNLVYETNTYTYNDFKRLQDAGMVFLPAAGRRNGNREYGTKYINEAGNAGYYWSALTNCDYCLYFGYETVRAQQLQMRYTAFSVRLVTDVNAETE